MALKIGIIGPSNLEKLSRITNKPKRFFLDKAQKIGKDLAEIPCEIWLNADKGMGFNIAKSYKKNKGQKVVILYPGKDEPWPNKQVLPYKKYADELREEPNWFWANYNVASQPDICLCVGISAGTLSELAYIKWNHKLKRGNLKKLVAVKELLRERQLPIEIEADIKKILVYLNKAEDVKNFVKKFKKA